jgi:Flp pilus assembly protein TadG
VIQADEGSAVVEFVLVSILVVALLLGVVQLGIALHVRNTLVAAAAEGARYAAAANREPQEGAQYTADLIEQTLPGSFSGDVTAGYEEIDGVPTIVVEVKAELPLLGWLGPSDTLVVRGHAMEES